MLLQNSWKKLQHNKTFFRCIKRCSSCSNNVWYCGEDHLKLHKDVKNGNECFPFKIIFVEGVGRYILEILIGFSTWEGSQESGSTLLCFQFFHVQQPNIYVFFIHIRYLVLWTLSAYFNIRLLLNLAFCIRRTNEFY